MSQMKNGNFINKIKRLRLNVTKLHRHVFENPGNQGAIWHMLRHFMWLEFF